MFFLFLSAQRRGAVARATSVAASFIEPEDEQEDQDEEEEIDLISPAGSLEDLIQQTRAELQQNVEHRTPAPRTHAHQPSSDIRRATSSHNVQSRHNSPGNWFLLLSYKPVPHFSLK